MVFQFLKDIIDNGRFSDIQLAKFIREAYRYEFSHRYYTTGDSFVDYKLDEYVNKKKAQEDISQKRSVAGKLGAKSRWNSQSSEHNKQGRKKSVIGFIVF